MPARNGNIPFGNRALLLSLTTGMFILFLMSLDMGRMDISLPDLFRMLTGLSASPGSQEALQSQAIVFFQVRLPRCLTALIVGMGMAGSGAVYQSMFRNPLVSPDILGVAAGCTFGAALGLIIPGSSFGLVRVLAFIFGLAAVLLTTGIARAISIRPILILVLAGLVVSAMFSALLMSLKYIADPYNELPAIVFWTMGSFCRTTWPDCWILAPVVGAGLLCFHLLRYRLNILSLGDDQARSLGISPLLFRGFFIGMSSLIVALCVSACGQIGWVGLVIPHIARTLVGPDHIRMLPVTILIGGLFMLMTDDLARTLSSAELPLGVITSMIGAPLFALLLYKNRGTGWA